MQVKAINTIFHPGGVCLPGEVVNLGDADAIELIGRGIATANEDQTEAVSPADEPVETEDDSPEAEDEEIVDAEEGKQSGRGRRGRR